MSRMDPENIIKGRIAEAIVEELLRSSGNKVYRFGYESILQNLTQTDSRFDRYSGNGEQVRSIPDFVVVNSEGRSFFVEVKFRSDPVWLLKTRLLKQLKEYWQAKLILVTIAKPSFRVIDPQLLFKKDYSFLALEDDPDFHVTLDSLKEFVPLVKKFLMNGKTAHRDLVADSSVK
jgi:hypothetical protein